MDSHVTISPADGLPVLAPPFPPDADESETIVVQSKLTIENKSDDNVLFKMKINFHKAYCTLKPTVGYLRAGESSEVLVTLKLQPSFSLTDMDWNIKVYDIIDFRADEEPEDSLNSREKWSVIDDRVAHKTLIPIKFVLDGEKGAETETDGMPQSVPSQRFSRVAVALRSLPTPPPAPPSTPVPVERPKSPPLERKVRARAFAKDLGDNVHGAAIDASAIDVAVQAIRAQNRELSDSIAKMSEAMKKECDAAVYKEDPSSRMPIIYEEDDSIGPMKPSSLTQDIVASSESYEEGYRAMTCDMATEIKRVEKDVVQIKYLLVGLLVFEGLRSMYSLFGYF